MGLTTTLDTMALTDLLQWLQSARKTGVVRVTRGNTNVLFSFTEGRLSGASSNDPPSLLGQFLLSRGKLTADQLHDALEQQEKTRRGLGDILIAAGIVTDEELECACTAKAEETIFGMLEWTEAVVEFDPKAKPGPRMVPMDHGVEELLLQAAKRQDELRRMRQVFDDPGMVLCPTEHELPKEGDGSTLTERIYRAVNGKRTLAEVLLHMRTSEYLAMKLLFELYRRGIIRVKHVQEVAPANGTPEAVAGLVRRMVDRGDHDLALDLLANALHSHPRDRLLADLLERTEAALLEKTFREDLSKSALPFCVTPREELLEAPGIGATELFLLDLIDEGKWDVKSLIRLSPVHEVDVVRALVRLKAGRHIDLRETAPETDDVEVDKRQLRDLFRDIDASAAIDESIDRAFG